MKRFYRAFVALVLLLCLLPSLGLFVFGPASAGANEILAGPPQLLRQDGSLNTAFFADTVAWARDRFALRQEMITLWSALSVKLFGTSPVAAVTAGTDGWLYYTATLDDYSGVALSERELYAIARNLALLQEYAQENGMTFVFAAAPNKNTLYSQYMPASIPAAHEQASLPKLQALLDDLGVCNADLVAAFAEEPIRYFRTDSHWNSMGAALGADTLLRDLGREGAFYGGDFIEGDPHTGDLYAMLYPAGTAAETDLVPAEGFTFTCERDPKGGEAITIHTFCPDREGSLYCWRDSFGVALYPYLAESFGEAVFTRAGDYDLTKAVAAGADTVILELVERNLRNLAEKSLCFPSPVRGEPVNAVPVETEDLTVTETKTADGQTLFSVTGRFVHENSIASGIYICCDGVYYEVCICFDAEGNEGFSAWLPVQPGEALELVQVSLAATAE